MRSDLCRRSKHGVHTFFSSLSATSFLSAAAALSAMTSIGLAGTPAADSPVVAAEINEANWGTVVPRGKEVDAIYGDYVLQNDHLRAVIAKPVATRHANMTVRTIGGCLIDLTSRHHESDQLSAFYPGRRAFTFSGDADTSTTQSSAKVDGLSTTAHVGMVRVTAEGTDTKPALEVSYWLADHKRHLEVVSTWTNTTKADITLTLEDDLRADGGKEDMPKIPNGTHDVYWFQDIYWQQAYAIHAPGFRIRCNSNARESVLTYEPTDGQPIVVKPGESFSLTRHIFAGRHLPEILANCDESRGTADELAKFKLIVVAQGKPLSNARVSLACGDQQRGTLVTGDAGAAELALPSGQCVASVTFLGRKLGDKTLTVANGKEQMLAFDQHLPGLADVTVVDQDGRSIPAKIEFKGSGETPTPDWGPETAEHFVRNLAYTPNGKAMAVLPAGNYDVTISHGPEYDAEFTKLTVTAGETATMRVTLPHVVDTKGWVSSDFHSHSSPSGDNTGSQLGRVLNLAAEHIEFAPCTEHNRISTYDDHIASQKLKAFLATVTGMELTGSPLPLNHQNVFPLIMKPRTQDGGAPVTDASPEAQMERIAAWDNNSVKLIQQNHPDLGWLFYDKNGDQKPDEGYSRTFTMMNVTEIHPIDPLLNPTQFEIRDGKKTGNQTALNWLQLLNQGFRIYGVVNTDAHYNFHGSGGVRNWIRSTTDDPARIDSDEMRDASRNGHMVMSNGPFLEAQFHETNTRLAPVSAGDDLLAKSKKVTASIRVQCPNWLDVDVVFVLVNGRRSDKLTFTRDKNPDMFGTGPVKFSQNVDVELTEDAHLIVLTGHRSEVVGDIMGPFYGTQHPTALSNPVFVDIDGDGFKANKDTLDIPLPVKFVAEK